MQVPPRRASIKTPSADTATKPSPSSTTSTSTTSTSTTSTSTTPATASKTASPVDGVDNVKSVESASAKRTTGKGLTEKLVDPKRTQTLDSTVGALLAFTPEELAFARAHPVVISADHNGAPLAAKLTAFLKAQGIPVVDHAAPMAAAAKGEKFPYAQAALPALVGLTNGSAERVVLICGNGIGMRDVAKQWPGANVVYGEILHEVRSSRKAEDTNVLALGARLLGDDIDLAKLFVKTFVATKHQGMPERYQTQTDQIAAWAAMAAEKGAALCIDDFGDAIPKGATTGAALPLREVMLRRHDKDTP